MRIHTNLTSTEISGLAYGIDGVYVEYTSHGSRSRARAFDFHLVADERKGRRRANSGSYGAGYPAGWARAKRSTYNYAATWDEWGIVFARLFALDPKATCYAYDGADDYHWQTANRFRPFTEMIRIEIGQNGRERWVFPDAPAGFEAHDQHRWVFDGQLSDLNDGIRSHRCKCGAIKRYRRTLRTVTS